MVLPLQKQSNLAQGLPKKDDKEEPAMEKAKEITTEVKQEIKEAAAEAATKLRPKVQLVGLRETICGEGFDDKRSWRRIAALLGATNSPFCR
jgi:hypothetical protein